MRPAVAPPLHIDGMDLDPDKDAPPAKPKRSGPYVIQRIMARDAYTGDRVWEEVATYGAARKALHVATHLRLNPSHRCWRFRVIDGNADVVKHGDRRKKSERCRSS